MKFADNCPLHKPYDCFSCPLADCISTQILSTQEEARYKACGFPKKTKKKMIPTDRFLPMPRYHLHRFG